ncbi:MAG: ComF family protein [Lachnospiraceae bacterium]|nr:ComF family protein [Lachnospiraceae bacterium]
MRNTGKNRDSFGLKRLGNAVLDLLYPRRCPVCGDIIMPKGGECCDRCRGAFAYVTEPYCLKCGKPLREETEALCPDCLRKERFFDFGRAVYRYDDRIGRSIYGFKYNGRQEYARFYAQEIVRRYGRMLSELKPDALVPIPLHKKRLRKRGYNQAALIAQEVSRLTGIPAEPSLLQRVRNTRPQKSLNERERENNLKKAFKIRQNDVSLETVILIDDIFTTGSTMDSAAGCLRDQGVKGVYFIVLSITSV